VTERLIVKALIEAKKEFKPLKKNKINPHFKSKYADLSAVFDSIDEALAKHGLAYTQPFERDGAAVYIVTKLMHIGGEEMLSWYPLPSMGKPQEFGSAVTYGRRFSICSLLGIAADDDDDANGAAVAAVVPKPSKPDAAPIPIPPERKESALTDAKVWIGVVTAADPEQSGASKFIHLKGEDGIDLLLQQPSEKDKAAMDIYGMMFRDICGAVRSKTELAITYGISPKGNKLVQGCKPAPEMPF